MDGSSSDDAGISDRGMLLAVVWFVILGEADVCEQSVFFRLLPAGSSLQIRGLAGPIPCSAGGDVVGDPSSIANAGAVLMGPMVARMSLIVLSSMHTNDPCDGRPELLCCSVRGTELLLDSCTCGWRIPRR